MSCCLASCCAETICCTGSSLLCSGCKCCMSSAPCSKEQIAKPVYAFIFVLVSIASWVLSIWAGSVLGWIPVIEDAGECCSGPIAVYRLTWALFLFHVLLALSLIGVTEKSDGRAQIHFDWYSLKFVFFFLLCVIAFVIPNPFFFYYGWVALVGAAIFIILQLLMLVDFAHTLNEEWVEKYEETGDKRYLYLLAFFTFVCFTISIVLTVLMYVYQIGPQTWVSPFCVTLNIILCSCMVLLSLHPAVQSAERSTPIGVFQASFVTCYSSYLVFAGLMDATDSTSLQTTTIVIGCVFVIICVGYTAIRISGHEETYFGNEEEESSMKLVVNDETDKPQDDQMQPVPPKAATPTSEEQGPTSYNYSFFHLVFAFGATYVCMLLTSWAAISSDENNTLKIDSGQTSMWVKIGTSWIVLFLYSWTAIAPLVVSSRKW
jgi:serine incorporator 1/3